MEYCGTSCEPSAYLIHSVWSTRSSNQFSHQYGYMKYIWSHFMLITMTSYSGIKQSLVDFYIHDIDKYIWTIQIVLIYVYL